MSTAITVRLSAGSYVARAKGHKGTASSAISPRFAANGMANKLGIDFTLLQYQGEKDDVHVFVYEKSVDEVLST